METYSIRNKPLVTYDQNTNNLNFELNNVIEKLPRGNRIVVALQEPPINGLLAINGQMTSQYAEADSAVNLACKIHNICNHGFINHLLPVIENVFTLKDIADQGIYKNSQIILPKGNISRELSDGDTACPILIHDLIYGKKEIVWNGYNIDQHEKMAVIYLKKMKEGKLSDLGNLDNHAIHTSFERLEQLSSVYEQVISSNTTEMIAYTNTLVASNTVTPKQILSPIAVLADKLDYFRDGRLMGVNRELGNIYFDQAASVEGYTITHSEEVIFYNVVMNNKYMNFKDWYESTKETYPEIWELGLAVANLLGRRFLVKEVA
ncbi:MAG TPA: hypothetical protein VLF89_01045 [Candidatus Saccharimonadales bacterium]|nr:hypothetical protein [Candidatus Saccharimonadales bacterium]